MVAFNFHILVNQVFLKRCRCYRTSVSRLGEVACRRQQDHCVAFERRTRRRTRPELCALPETGEIWEGWKSEEKRVENLGKDSKTPFFVYNIFVAIPWTVCPECFFGDRNWILRTMESDDMTLCYAQGPIVFRFNSHPLYSKFYPLTFIFNH